MRFFECDYGLDYVKERAKDIYNGNKDNINFGDYNSKHNLIEYELCSYEDNDLMLGVYLGVYYNELVWTFNKILELDTYGRGYEWENIGELFVCDINTLDLDSLEDLEKQAKELLEKWHENRLIDDDK